MRFVSRQEQSSTLIGYSVFPRPPRNWADPTKDSFYDGEPSGQKSLPIGWVEEQDVHRAQVLSRSVESNRLFLGPQMLAIRDEVRHATHVLVPEKSGLSLALFQGGDLSSRRVVSSGCTQRAHLSLDKYSGQVSVIHCGEEGKSIGVFIDGKPLKSSAKNADFPFMELSQPPIGHVAKTPPAFGLITYKCRHSGNVYLRRIVGGKIGNERKIACPKCVGGMDFAIAGNNVLFRINALTGDGVQPMIALSRDGGKTIRKFTAIEISEAPIAAYVPSGSPIQVDYNGNLHVPISVLVEDGQHHLLDVLSGHDLVVDALEANANRRNIGILMAFPKKPRPLASVGALAVGDGVSDGAGIIATVVSDGDILSSNSQTGGTSYPDPALLNIDMAKVYALKTTQCYTRGIRPNCVSMDYLFLEADEKGASISKQLFIETWDMPLPRPIVKATARGKNIHVKIIKDGWFEVGSTTFSVDDPSVGMRDVEIIDDRYAVIKCDAKNLKGANITFTMKNKFYHHEGDAVIT